MINNNTEKRKNCLMYGTNTLMYLYLTVMSGLHTASAETTMFEELYFSSSHDNLLSNHSFAVGGLAVVFVCVLYLFPMLYIL